MKDFQEILLIAETPSELHATTLFLDWGNIYVLLLLDSFILPPYIEHEKDYPIFFFPFIYFWLRWFFVAWAFSSCSERGLLFVVVHRLLIAVTSLVVEHGL